MMQGYHAHLVEELKHLRHGDVPVPRNYKEAVSGEFAKYWKEAIAKEIENLREHKVFEWVMPPPGQFLIDSNWAWKAKSNEKGQISRFKARLVAHSHKAPRAIQSS